MQRHGVLNRLGRYAEVAAGGYGQILLPPRFQPSRLGHNGTAGFGGDLDVVAFHVLYGHGTGLFAVFLQHNGEAVFLAGMQQSAAVQFQTVGPGHRQGDGRFAAFGKSGSGQRESGQRRQYTCKQFFHQDSSVFDLTFLVRVQPNTKKPFASMQRNCQFGAILPIFINPASENGQDLPCRRAKWQRLPAPAEFAVRASGENSVRRRR